MKILKKLKQKRAIMIEQKSCEIKNIVLQAKYNKTRNYNNCRYYISRTIPKEMLIQYIFCY